VAPLRRRLAEEFGEVLQDVIGGFCPLPFPGGHRLLANTNTVRELSLGESEALTVTHDPRSDRTHNTSVRIVPRMVEGSLPGRSRLCTLVVMELHACNTATGVVIR